MTEHDITGRFDPPPVDDPEPEPEEMLNPELDDDDGGFGP